MVRMMVRLLVSGDKRVRVTVGVHSPVFSAGRYADVCAAHQYSYSYIWAFRLLPSGHCGGHGGAAPRELLSNAGSAWILQLLFGCECKGVSSATPLVSVTFLINASDDFLLSLLHANDPRRVDVSITTRRATFRWLRCSDCREPGGGF